MSPTIFSLSTCYWCGRWIGWGYRVLGNLCNYTKVDRHTYRVGCKDGVINL